MNERKLNEGIRALWRLEVGGTCMCVCDYVLSVIGRCPTRFPRMRDILNDSCFILLICFCLLRLAFISESDKYIAK